MAHLPEIGKISADVFRDLIFPHLGARNPNILVGPQHGVDVGIFQVGSKAVAITTDPVFIVPEYGFEKAAWFAVHILMSDVVTSGLAPTYLSIDLNLPLSINEEQLTLVWQTMSRECEKQGCAIICGHTARYENCHYPMVGGATVLAVGDRDAFVSPKYARPGDAVIITKGPAIEACGIFGAMFPNYIGEKLGRDVADAAQSLFYKMSVVEDALQAVRVGVRDNGVSALHDATECGIWGGIHELASAAGAGARIDREKFVFEKCVPEICDLFKIDPFASISEGTLIITSRAHRADEIVRILAQHGIRSSMVGELTEKKYGITVREGNRVRKLEHPGTDPFWEVFYRALRERLT